LRRYIIRRVIFCFLIVVGVSILIFAILPLTGDPINIMLPPGASEEVREALIAHHGFDEPMINRFFIFIRNAFLRGDFGYSFHYRAPALPLVLSRFPATLELSAFSIIISALISFPAGILSAIRRNSLADNIVRVFVFIGQGAPTFWTGLILIMIFSVRLRIFPVSGRSGLLSLVLPSLTIAFFISAMFTRMIRSSMLEVLSKDYIRTARSKGLFEKTVIYKHALRNALIPVITTMGIIFALLLGGSVVVETVFAWPGIGRLLVSAIHNRDFPVIQANIFVFAICFVFINLFVDLLFGYIDPRIKYN